jgi:hypothetical protein
MLALLGCIFLIYVFFHWLRDELNPKRPSARRHHERFTLPELCRPYLLRKPLGQNFQGSNSETLSRPISRPRKGQLQDGELNSPLQGQCCIGRCVCGCRRPFTPSVEGVLGAFVRSPRFRGQ